MLPVGLSRWTMAYFAAALAAFVGAQLLMAAGLTYPAEPLLNGRTLVGLHLITIGWITLLMVGALLQFVPVITGTPAIAAYAGLPSLIAIIVGLGGMEVGFLALNGDVAATLMPALPFGGGCVIGGLALVGGVIAHNLFAGRPLALSGRFVAVGLFFLLLTTGLGLAFALAFAWPEVFPWGSWISRGIRVHVMSGLVGWFTLTAVGVSYRLLSMFMLAPEDDSRIGARVLHLAASGLALLWLDAFLSDAPLIGALWGGSTFLLVVAALLYLADMVRMYRARRRPVLELNSRASAAALVALALCVIAFVIAETVGGPDSLVGPLCYFLLFGWLSGLALGQLYKIIPFLTWLERYGPRLGKESVPRVQDLVNERRAAPWFILYFLAVAVGTICGVLGLTDLWRAAIALHLVATLFIIREFWRARHLWYVGLAKSPQAILQPQALPRSTSLPT